jgi:hypothetical protein
VSICKELSNSYAIVSQVVVHHDFFIAYHVDSAFLIYALRRYFLINKIEGDYVKNEGLHQSCNTSYSGALFWHVLKRGIKRRPFMVHETSLA